MTILGAMMLGLLSSGMGQAPDPQRPASFATTVSRDIRLDYLLYEPPASFERPAAGWPLILFLHGAGERGNELERVKTNGLPQELAAGRTLPAVVISPQCPAGTRWNGDWMLAALDALLDDALARYDIDPDRVYLTGISMGGFGTWALGALRPERFAALAPVCGGGDPGWAVALRRLPIWAFHGAKDDIVPVQATREMADAITRAHGDIRVTIFPEAGHASWIEAFADPALYEWLLAQRRQASPLVRPAAARLTASSGDPSLAFDGDPGTRWESAWEDPQWLAIDLGKPTALGRLAIVWEAAYGKSYDILASADGQTWDTVASETAGDGGVDVVDFPAGFTARHLKFAFAERGTQWGTSIWEIELE